MRGPYPEPLDFDALGGRKVVLCPLPFFLSPHSAFECQERVEKLVAQLKRNHVVIGFLLLWDRESCS